MLDNDLLAELKDVGVSAPVAGDRGDERVRHALAHELRGRRRRGRRIRLPFGGRTIAPLPAALLVAAVTAAAAGGAIALFDASPATLFESNPASPDRPGYTHETVIRSTIRMIDTFQVPGVGPVRYWVADTREHGLCQALGRPDGSWAGYPDGGTGAGEVPGCSPTREQAVAQGGLLPMSVDEHSVSIEGLARRWWDVYYGIVSADGAAGIKDPRTGRTAPLIAGRYFVLVEREANRCEGCDNLRAIDAAGHILPANYGPQRDRNH